MVVVFDRGSYSIALAVLKQHRLASNLKQSSCLSLPSVGVIVRAAVPGSKLIYFISMNFPPMHITSRKRKRESKAHGQGMMHMPVSQHLGGPSTICLKQFKDSIVELAILDHIDVPVSFPFL